MQEKGMRKYAIEFPPDCELWASSYDEARERALGISKRDTWVTDVTPDDEA